MKKIIYLLIFSGVILSFGCDSFVDKKEYSKENNFVNPFEEIGKLHNKALSSIKTNSINLDNLDEFTHVFVESECERKFNVPSEPLYAHTVKMMENAKKIGVMLEKSELSRSYDVISDSVRNEIPKDLAPYVDKMFKLIHKNMSDSIEIETEFAMIDLMINKDVSISIEDKNMLWAVSSIIKYSYMYNLDEICSRSVTADSVVQADAEGAIGGFLSWKFWGKTVASGLVFGPTGAVVAATKEIVKGAIMGSGVHVAINIW